MGALTSDHRLAVAHNEAILVAVLLARGAALARPVLLVWRRPVLALVLLVVLIAEKAVVTERLYEHEHSPLCCRDFKLTIEVELLPLTLALKLLLNLGLLFSASASLSQKAAFFFLAAAAGRAEGSVGAGCPPSFVVASESVSTRA